MLATLDPPKVVLSTHFDCVPPFFPSSETEGVLHGRGSCDAKGILAAQVGALEQLRPRACAMSVVCSWWGRSGGATAPTSRTILRTRAGS